MRTQRIEPHRINGIIVSGQVGTGWMVGLVWELGMRKSSKAKLREAFLHLENEVPGSVVRHIRNLRQTANVG